jgi:hypothetical protein
MAGVGTHASGVLRVNQSSTPEACVPKIKKEHARGVRTGNNHAN